MIVIAVIGAMVGVLLGLLHWPSYRAYMIRIYERIPPGHKTTQADVAFFTWAFGIMGWIIVVTCLLLFLF